MLPGAVLSLHAGDLLRGGASANTAPTGGAAATGAAAVAATAGLPSQADRLARTTQALQAVQALQAAARAAAAAGANNLGADLNHPGQTLPNVPNGLVPGGLVVAPGGVWQGANLPVQTAAAGQTTVSITQTSQQALLNWQTFNVGKNTTVNFDQSAGGAGVGQWIAFNTISDPSGVPSQILGSIQAQGQVYLINQNGIIFGGTAQVNTHSLVASSLPLNSNLVTLGLLNNPDLQFLFSTLTISSGSNGTPAFKPPANAAGLAQNGNVTVQAGATLTSPASSANTGGLVALIGPNVANAGTIATPDGQTILAAGLQVALTGHASSDPSLRGLDVFVGAVNASSGVATNSGLIEVPEADLTMAGLSVNQLGFVNSSTSVSLNGRVDLLSAANTVVAAIPGGVAAFYPTTAGTVTLGPGSTTQILPELSSTATQIGTQLALPSQVNLMGLAVYLASGAEILAPNANATIKALTWLPFNGIYLPAETAGQVYLDTGAQIDVSGSTDVAASVQENIVAVQLTGTELANSPVQRGGPLQGQTIRVDLRQTGTYNGQVWVGTPLANVSGFLNNVERTVGELTVAGGTVTLSAGNSVVMQPGSAINVSSGWINYTGGVVQTSQVISGGHIYDIAKAPPDLVYDGIVGINAGQFVVTASRYGISESFPNPALSTNSSAAAGSSFQAGYVQGGGGGTLAIIAPAMALDGSLLGQSVSGPRQRTILPGNSSLALEFLAQDPTYSSLPNYSPTPPAVIFTATSSLPLAAAFGLDGSGNPLPLVPGRINEVDLAPGLVGGGGFGSVMIDDRDGNISLPVGVALTAPAGGSVTLVGSNLDLEGSLSAPGGSLSLTANNLSQSTLNALGVTQFTTPAPDPTRGQLTLGPAAVLSTAGLLVDDRASSPTFGTLPLVTNGGSVTLIGYSARLAADAIVNVSGGVAISIAGKYAYGNAGSISLKAGQDPNDAAVSGGQFGLGATLLGYAGGKGGSLILLAPQIQIGGSSTVSGALRLDPSFFSTGGFTNFTIEGLAVASAPVPSLDIVSGTVINPVASLFTASTVGGKVSLTPTLAPVGVRPPVSLNLGAVSVTDPFTSLETARGNLELETGVVIQTDPGAGVTLSGDTVTVLGSVIAPGGAISISGGKNTNAIFNNPSQALLTVVLGPSSVLSAAGTTLVTPNARGFVTGSVLPGGSINLSGNIATEAGAVLNVSGASGVLDLAPAVSGTVHGGSTTGLPVVPTRLDSNGGTISLTGAQELFTDATLLGVAGGPTAVGGSLVISSGRFYSAGSGAPLPTDITLAVTQAGPTLAAGTVVVGSMAPGAGGTALGNFAAHSFNAAGFDSLTLGGVVQFSGPVTLTAPASLTIGTGGIIYANAAVTLNAPYVALGTAFQAPPIPQQIETPFLLQGSIYPVAPTHGPGSLTVTATALIDIGNLSLQNIGATSFNAGGGDIRGDGTLDVAGSVQLQAGQIYPPTEVSFTVAAYNYGAGGATQPGSVTIAAGGPRALPLSAGGQLNLYASVITQGGTLRAPIGGINLGWDGIGPAPTDPLTGAAVPVAQSVTLTTGSITSVSAVDPITGRALTIPYGVNLNGTSWIDPAGNDITAGGVPRKTVNLSAVGVTDQAGAAVDLTGGGDLYAYRFVAGTGGSLDILSSTASFAVIPGYALDYAPFAPYNTASPNFSSDLGYVNGSLAVGQQVQLGAGGGLSAGIYTLLPARYALLPGAFLVTPESGTPTGVASPQPDGSIVVSGWGYNRLDAARTLQPQFSPWKVESLAVVRTQAEYDDSLANRFLAASALANSAAVPRLPVDAGQLVLQATSAMAVQGSVSAGAPSGGRGGLVDLGSPGDILIGGPGATAPAGTLVLNAADLSAFDAESLLIGGVRATGATGTAVGVTTNNLTVDNAGNPLTGLDLILVANDKLTLAPGADLEQSVSAAIPGSTLLLGNAAVTGSGNGVLLRVSGNLSSPVLRSGVSAASGPDLVVGAGARLVGASLTLDSSGATSLDPAAVLDAKSVALNSGQISLQLNRPGLLQPTTGLVLSGAALQGLQASAQALSLLSYSSIDIYGTGQVGALNGGGLPVVASLALHAAEIRGFNAAGGTVTFNALGLTLDNSAAGTVPGPVATASGTLVFNTATISLGSNQLAVDQYSTVSLNASSGVLAQGTGGLAVPGTLNLTTPVLTGATAASQTLSAGGALTITAPASGGPAVTGGLGAQLTLKGASVTDNANIMLPSGSLTLNASSGSVVIGNLAASRLDVGGTAQSFFDQVRFTNGGQLNLVSGAGAVNVAAGATLNVAAQPGGGNAGAINVSAPAGTFTLAGTLLGAGGNAGQAGSFSLDEASLPGGSLAALDSVLGVGGFSQSLSFRLRNGNVNVDGLATAKSFNLSADQGSITVSGTIDASGATGGVIGLEASGGVTLASGALLTVAAQNFNAAGRGGAVTLEAGNEINGATSPTAFVNVATGSTVNLGVAVSTTASATLGDFTGTLLLRAPQNSAGTDLQVAPLNGAILNASTLTVEGDKIYDLTTSGTATITSALQSSVMTNGTTFGNASAAITARLLAANAALAPVLVVEPGAEIINRTGGLTLPSNWNLATFRFGPDSVAGGLTLRTSGNLVLLGSLSDGFTTATYNSTLLTQNLLLPATAQSWSYQLVAGADFSAADADRVQPLATLAANTGTIALGRNDGINAATSPGASATTSSAVAGNYQVIRTGTGNIDLSAANDVQLLNQFATIYTVGTLVTDPTLGGTFTVPVLSVPAVSSLGGAQETPIYPAQYTLAGGDLTIAAQHDIVHYTQNSAGALIPDSDRELPVNWLDRRGNVNPATGLFSAAKNGGFASTTWWVDFSNFFEGVGALGGGNVTLNAGHDVSNVDAVVPTNARMPSGRPNAAGLVELGGGNLAVTAGDNLNGGVYYVERGTGTLYSGNSILTNSTRSPTLGTIRNPAALDVAQTWLPTTLFLGQGGFNVAALGSVLLGPVANPFLLPEGLSNTFWDKSYFSTYATGDTVHVSSLTGAVTLRESATVPGATGNTSLLGIWLQQVLLFNGSSNNASFFQPWLRLDEVNVSPFLVAGILPGSLRVTAFSGDLNIAGNLTLSPSPTGTVDLAVAGSINGLQLTGVSTANGQSSNFWAATTINLSDANPAAVPGIATPLSLTAPLPPTGGGQWALTSATLMNSVNLLFAESGATEGANTVIQTQQTLHAPGPLHAGDSDPVYLYAGAGNISGLTLFSGKPARVVAGADITDIALYLQNNHATDLSLVAAGRDLIAYDPNSPLLTAAQATGNKLDSGSAAESGDIQVGGPGTVEVLAGRNFNLGVGSAGSNGIGVGLTSIGNTRNPYLPSTGASIIAGAGIGVSSGLDSSAMDFSAFILNFLNPLTSGAAAATYLPDLAPLLGLTNATMAQTWAAFSALPAAQQDALALDLFYNVLRDAGRDHGVTTSPGFGNYHAGFAAIAALFPGQAWSGDVSLTSREIKTASGGDVSLFAPGGQLTVGFNVSGAQAVDQGILTQDGGNISLFTRDSVIVGTSRIFTLRGGNEIIWSSTGNIAAGASSRTVQSAPPTRVLIDPQSANVQTDLAGLATGGGIGVLATVAGVPAGNVDLIAPAGVVDAGDAGIRSSGNLNISAVQVLNAGNISVSGSSVGTPAPVAAPNIGGLVAATSAANGAANAGTDTINKQTQIFTAPQTNELPSIITIEVLGYGGGT